MKEAANGLSSVYETWATKRRIDPFVLVWPSEPVNFHGKQTEDVMPFDLPNDASRWPTFLRDLVKKTTAYALLLVEQREQAVVVIFESPHGTKSWNIPIKNHGNVNVLGEAKEKSDIDYIGLLWSPKRGVG